MKSPKDQRTIVYLKPKSTPQDQNGLNRNAYTSSFKVMSNQEVQFEDNVDEILSLHNLSLEDLKNKVKMYNNLFMENKINVFNAFEIDLINCVQLMIKKTNETNYLEMSNLFDAISKVYSCRVDDFLTMGNKLVNAFLSEMNHKKHSKNEIKVTRNRKKVMLTTADKLHQKEHLVSSKTKYLSIDFDNDIIDYANPSRILINTFNCNTYWPEYNFSKKFGVNNNKNQEVKYEMKNISYQIEKGEICPYYHHLMAECDNNTNNDDLNEVDNIITYFNPETSTLSIDSSEESQELMDMKEQNSEKNVSISQTLSIVDARFSDYTFFDPKQLRYFKCPNHWKDKFKQMIMTSKQKAMHIKSCIAINDCQTSMKTNVSKEQCSKSKNIQYKVDFNINMNTIIKKVESNLVKHQCDYSVWKPCNDIIHYTNESLMSPFRRLEFCKYINMVPDWNKNDGIKGLMELNNKTSQNSIFIFPEQDILKKKLTCNEILENTDNIITNNVCIPYEENCRNEREISNDYNYNSQDDTHEVTEVPKCIPEYTDMNIIKRSICNIIKPDGNEILSITFKDLLLRLKENMKENVSVAVIYVALLHLCNEYNLHLENDDNEIVISQG